MDCSFKEYMEIVYSYLACNNPETVEYVVYSFSEELINKYDYYFYDKYKERVPAYKALSGFNDFLNAI